MAKDKKDVLQLGPELEDGARPYIRDQDGQLSCGLLGKPTPTGKSLHGAGLIMEHRGPGPRFNVLGEFDAPAPAPAKAKGPAKVTTDAYRAGWDQLFGGTTVGEA